MTQASSVAGATPTRPALQRAYAPLIGVTSLFILCQAVTAGQFVSQEDRDAWIDVHDMVGYVTVLLGIVTAIVGMLAFRSSARAVAWGSLALAVLLVIQTVIGHLITDLELDGFIGLHVPLALVVFGLTAWLVARSVVGRTKAPVTPKTPGA